MRHFVPESLHFIIMTVEEIIQKALGNEYAGDYKLEASGFSSVYLVSGKSAKYIVKIYDKIGISMSEANGLNALKENQAKVPEVISCGDQYIAMEYILKGNPQRNDLIEMLIRLYSNKAEQFGYTMDNTIGSLIQKNKLCHTFHDFFWKYRLLPRFEQAVRNGFFKEKDADVFYDIYLSFLSRYDFSYSCLVHGDLWNGNVLASSNGYYIIDPSVAYSNPGQDLAMLALFGSPLTSGDLAYIFEAVTGLKDFPARISFFQLYPLLVHINLFGSSYTSRFRNALKDCGGNL